MITRVAFVFLIFTTPLLGQQAEKVLPITHAVYPDIYYQTQLELWKDICDSEEATPDSWHNYYRAARNYNALSGERLYDLTAIVNEAVEAFPNSFEAKYLLFAESPFENKRWDLLLEAHQEWPERVEAYHNLLHYYKVIGESEGLAEAAKKLLQSDWYADGILDWNYNALQSVAPNGILITIGDNDTYPAWMLQAAKGIRPDVEVININLFVYDENYRNNTLDRLPIKGFDAHIGSDLEGQLAGVLLGLAASTDQPLYLGIASSRAHADSLTDRLFLTGMAFQYAEKPMDNLPILQENVEQKFRLDELRGSLSLHPQQAVADHMNLNYLPALALLHNWYQEKNWADKAEQIVELAATIAQKGNRQDIYNQLFAQPDLQNTTVEEVNFRKFDKELHAVQEGVYAHATEVTRTLFATFLADLRRSGKEDLADHLTPRSVDWASLLPEPYNNFDQGILNDGGSPNDDYAPIVNITHEAAVAFCNWMTERYNTSDHRKKRFTKVQFRLPTEEEWVKAASGIQAGPYPWGGPYIRNVKGCYLANFNPNVTNPESMKGRPDYSEVQEAPSADGSNFPVRVDAYFPNDNGFYNMSGNVAEMLQGGDHTKGGSWLDPSYYLQINVTQEATLPSPAVGFRIFMDVLEE